MGKEENGISTAILNYLHAIRVDAWRQSNHAVPILKNVRGGVMFLGWRKDPNRMLGIGDISGILRNGKRLEIEVKTSKGVQSPEQKQFQALIEKNGGVYILARCYDDVITYFEKINYVKG